MKQGYKTGYVYKNPEVFQGEQKGDRAATTPATVTSTRSRTPYYTPEIERGPVRRAHSTGRANTYRNRLKWLNSPVKSTEYKKEKEKAEIDEDYEPAIIKDLQPEKEDKDQEVLVWCVMLYRLLNQAWATILPNAVFCIVSCQAFDSLFVRAKPALSTLYTKYSVQARAKIHCRTCRRYIMAANHFVKTQNFFSRSNW